MPTALTGCATISHAPFASDVCAVGPRDVVLTTSISDGTNSSFYECLRGNRPPIKQSWDGSRRTLCSVPTFANVGKTITYTRSSNRLARTARVALNCGIGELARDSGLCIGLLPFLFQITGMALLFLVLKVS